MLPRLRLGGRRSELSCCLAIASSPQPSAATASAVASAVSPNPAAISCPTRAAAACSLLCAAGDLRQFRDRFGTSSRAAWFASLVSELRPAGSSSNANIGARKPADISRCSCSSRAARRSRLRQVASTGPALAANQAAIAGSGLGATATATVPAHAVVQGRPPQHGRRQLRLARGPCAFPGEPR